MIKLFLREITDYFIKDNFQTLVSHIQSQKILNAGWVFISFSEAGAVTDKVLRHGLSAIPKDIIITKQTGAGVLTWNYDKFNRETISYSTTGPCAVRAFVGLYKEEA